MNIFPVGDGRIEDGGGTGVKNISYLSEKISNL